MAASTVLQQLDSHEYENHVEEVLEVRRRLGITHEHFDCWIFNFLQNKKFNIDETVAKFERRSNMERKDLLTISLTDYMKENMSQGIIQTIGEDKRGNITFYVVSARDFPSSKVRDERMRIFDMWLTYGTRMRYNNKRCRVTLLVNQQNASLWSNTDMSFQSSIALRVAKFYPGAFDRAYICGMGRALSTVAKPIISRMPAEISEKVFIYTDKEIADGCLHEFFDEHVLPTALGGTNDCDKKENYTKFYDDVTTYYAALKEGTATTGESVKEWELRRCESSSYPQSNLQNGVDEFPELPSPIRTREDSHFMHRTRSRTFCGEHTVVSSPRKPRHMSFADAIQTNEASAAVAASTEDSITTYSIDGQQREDIIAGSEQFRALGWAASQWRRGATWSIFFDFEAYRRGLLAVLNSVDTMQLKDLDAVRSVLGTSLAIQRALEDLFIETACYQLDSTSDSVGVSLLQFAARSQGMIDDIDDELHLRQRHSQQLVFNDLQNDKQIANLQEARVIISSQRDLLLCEDALLKRSSTTVPCIPHQILVNSLLSATECQHRAIQLASVAEANVQFIRAVCDRLIGVHQSTTQPEECASLSNNLGGLYHLQCTLLLGIGEAEDTTSATSNWQINDVFRINGELQIRSSPPRGLPQPSMASSNDQIFKHFLRCLHSPGVAIHVLEHHQWTNASLQIDSELSTLCLTLHEPTDTLLRLPLDAVLSATLGVADSLLVAGHPRTPCELHTVGCPQPLLLLLSLNAYRQQHFTEMLKMLVERRETLHRYRHILVRP